ncbi:MAG: hypothetical protein A3F46_01535 [Legionellales bacterium RIFCSPHIGHO2_12_FULL_42_9]|nr:MAG: hypothetical protein A3F46_01535 [Legionellales bacterium RIFCSPHIGHO2_12_FULL_42_9]
MEKQGDEGRVSYDAENHQAMVNLRAKKIADIAHDFEALVIEGTVSASLVLVGWGSTYGTLKAAVVACQAVGIQVALIHLRHLNPLPHDLPKLLASFKTILVAELNTGQLCQLLRSQYLVNAQSITQCNGLSFSVNDLVAAVQRSGVDNCSENA